MVAPEGLRGAAVDLRRGQLAAGGRGEGGAAALHQRDRAAADVLAERPLRPRYSGSFTEATSEVSSGRRVGSMRIRREASPTLIVSQPGSSCEGMLNS